MFGVTFSNIPPAAALTIHFFMGILFTAALLTCKRISIKGSGWVQVVTTCIKFMPLIVAAFIGIIIASISGGSTAEAEVATAATQTTFTPLTRMLRIFGVMPAVLFAYDSFINVASMTRRVKNGEKRMPFIIFFGLTVIIVLYTLVGFSSALTKTSTVSDMFKLLTTDQSVAFYLGKFIDVTIFVSAFGVLNGISMVYDTAMTNLVEIGALAGSEKAKKKFGKHTSLFYMVVTLSVLFIISGLVSIPFGTDIIIDGISSYVSMIFFIVYGAVVLLYTIKRKRFEITKLNPVAFYTSAISSVIGISIAVIFFVVSVITDTVSSEFSTLGWGLFADYGFQLRSFLPLVIFFLYILALFVLHVVNVFLVKREGRDVLAIIAAQKPQVEEEEEGCDSSCDSEKGCGLKGEAKETEKSTE